MVDEWSLNPLLVSQIKSVRPESMGYLYCDFFSSSPNQICRIAKSKTDSAFNYIWTSDYWGWLNPPVHYCDAVVEKLFRDKGRGTVFYPLDSHKFSSLLHNFASIIFTFDLNAVDSSQMAAFIIDSTLTQPSTSSIIPIQVHPDFSSALKHSPSSFKANAWLRALYLHPDNTFVHRIIDGIIWGRSLNFTGDRLTPRLCKNRTKATIFATELNIKIEKERSSGFRSGPFKSTLPLFNLKCHPRSAALKNFSDKVRLVIDMSDPHDGSSVNANCPDVELHYVKLEHIGSVIKKLGRGTVVFKFDVVAAFKQIRLIIDDWCLQGETFVQNNITCYDISTAANFGAKTSGYLWEEYGSALEFIFRWNLPIDALARYVDDFLAMTAPFKNEVPTLTLSRASETRDRVCLLAEELGVGLDKFQIGTCLDYLGITVDTINMCFRVPEDKKRRCLSELAAWIKRRTCLKRELLSLIGYLQFLTRVLPCGRAFLRRCIKLASSKRSLHHMITLTNNFRSDIKWWLDILPRWNGISLFSDDEWISPDNFEVDASLRGHGCFYNGSYYSQAWSFEELQASRRSKRESMPYLELRAVAFACSTFGDKWRGSKILCFSDCEGAVATLNTKRARTPDMQNLLRTIGTIAIRCDFDIRARHIPGLLNVRADPLSRLDINSFLLQVSLGKELQRVHPVPLPSNDCNHLSST